MFIELAIMILVMVTVQATEFTMSRAVNLQF